MAETARNDAFLSFNARDLEVVEELADRLRSEGVEPFLDAWEVLPGEEFQPRLAEGLGQSKTCVVFLGPSGLGPWQKKEILIANRKGVYDPEYRVIPVLLPGAERPWSGEVAHLEFLKDASWVEFRKTTQEQRPWEALLAGIRRIRPQRSAAEVRRYEGRRPYRGLVA